MEGQGIFSYHFNTKLSNINTKKYIKTKLFKFFHLLINFTSWWTINEQELKRITDKKNKTNKKSSPKKAKQKPKIIKASSNSTKIVAETNKRKSCDKSHVSLIKCWYFQLFQAKHSLLPKSSN